MTNLDLALDWLMTAPDGTYRLSREHGLQVILRKTGYQVGRPDIAPTAVNPSRLRLESWLRGRYNDLPRWELGCIGKWTDAEGDVHFDISGTYRNRDHAVEWARELGEQAIWDWAAMDSIYVNGEV